MIPLSDVCLISNEDEFFLWDKRITHIHMDHFNMLVHKDLVDGLPDLKFKNNRLCDAFQKRKQVRASCKSKYIVSTDRPLQLPHSELFGQYKTVSLGVNVYALVIVNDYSLYNWK